MDELEGQQADLGGSEELASPALPEPRPVRVGPPPPERRGSASPTATLLLGLILGGFVGWTGGLWLNSVPRPVGAPTIVALASPAPSPLTSGSLLAAPSGSASDGAAGAPASTVTIIPDPAPGANSAPIALPAQGAALGRPDAPVTIEFWADYQCPYCGEFVKRIFGPLASGPITAGSVRLVHRDFTFLGAESLDAAVLARYAASKGQFWPLHQLLFTNQKGENQGAFSRDNLVRYASGVGLSEAEVRAAFDDPALIAAVRDETAEGARIGVNSTPTIILSDGRRITGVPTAGALEEALKTALAGN